MSATTWQQHGRRCARLTTTSSDALLPLPWGRDTTGILSARTYSPDQIGSIDLRSFPDPV